MTGSILTPSDLEAFKRDGLLPVSMAFEPEWIELLRQGVEADLKNPSPRFEIRLDENSGACYCEDYWVWALIPQSEQFLRHSPAASLAAQVLEASSAFVVHTAGIDSSCESSSRTIRRLRRRVGSTDNSTNCRRTSMPSVRTTISSRLTCASCTVHRRG